MRRFSPAVAFAAGVILIILWVVLAFVAAFPTGWVHLPLAIGVCLIVAAIIQTGPPDG